MNGLQLSGYFGVDGVTRDAAFHALGHAMTPHGAAIVYAGAASYVDIANDNPQVAGVLTTAQLAGRVAPRLGLVVHDAPRNAFYALHEWLIEKGWVYQPRDPGVGGNAAIASTAQISPAAHIGANVRIGHHVVIEDGVWIGNDVTIGAGATIGVDGILYASEEGENTCIRHAGGVVIEDGATIFSRATIVRAIHHRDATRIGSASIVGIGATIGHDAVIGENCVVSGNCVVARGAVLATGAHLAMSCSIREYVHIGQAAQVKAGSVVIADVADAAVVSGNFATPHRARLMQYARDSR